MTYKEAIDYIHSVKWMGSRPGLARITELCHRIGDPEDFLRFIHVTGTNGKGSFCCMLSSVLCAAGYKTGLFTSPFVESFNERIMLDGHEISNEELAELTSEVKFHAELMEDKPTEFELITAIALLYYKKMKCDFVILEAGLGGRLDSTNVIKKSEVSVITGIDLDHTTLLGDTTAKIAAEKAGIIKEGCPVLFGEGDDDAFDVIKKTAKEKNSPFYLTDYSAVTDVESDLSESVFTVNDERFMISLVGQYQIKNSANVIKAVQILRSRGIEISKEALHDGLASARWKARFEVFSKVPLIIYDGAHNPQGIVGAVSNIKFYLSPLSPDGKIVLLMGVMADKDHRKMIKMLAPFVSSVFCVTPENARSLDSAGVLSEFGECGVRGEAFDSIENGVFSAVRSAEKEKKPLLCLGSLYMYADVKESVMRYLSEK